MKNTFKYLVVFSCFMVFMLVIGMQFVKNDPLLYTVCAVVSIGITMLFHPFISKTEFSSVLLLFTFMLLISVPFVGPKETTSLEKRELSAFPVFKASNIWQFFKQYQQYFSDRFAFRNKGMELIALIKLKAFNLSVVPDRVEIGVDQWLFSAGNYYTEITSKPFTPEELKLIETNLEITTRWMAARNISYYYVIIPAKCRIYPEKMPKALGKLNAFSRLDQVYTYIRNNKYISVIDVRPELIDAKKIRDTYMQTDTHWNEYGAFLGYKKIMEAFQKDFPDLQIRELSEYQLDSAIIEEGDLLMNMGLSKGIAFRNYRLKLKSGIKPGPVDSAYTGIFAKQVVIREMPGSPNKKKLFIARDSMTEFLKKYFSTSFDRAFYYWKPTLNVPLILQEKPDILLHEMAEVFTANMLILPPEIKADSVFMQTNYPEYYKIESHVDPNLLIIF